MSDTPQHSNPQVDGVIGIPIPGQNLPTRDSRVQSWMNRNPNAALEISIPAPGMTGLDRFGAFFCLVVAPGVIITLTVLLLTHVLSFAKYWWQLFMAFWISAAFLCGGLTIKQTIFTREDLTITESSYRIVRTNITWCSFLRILFLPSHFNDFETGNATQIQGAFQEVRRPQLRAEAVVESSNSRDGQRERGYVRLGLICFGHRLSRDEHEQLANEINHYLQIS
eukprot:g6219.t1